MVTVSEAAIRLSESEFVSVTVGALSWEKPIFGVNSVKPDKRITTEKYLELFKRSKNFSDLKHSSLDIKKNIYTIQVYFFVLLYL